MVSRQEIIPPDRKPAVCLGEVYGTRRAVTGSAIPLEELKYWSVEHQEPYATPEAVLQRLHPERAKV
jgi:Uncharacterized protein conserved in bacteria (DUF2093)